MCLYDAVQQAYQKSVEEVEAFRERIHLLLDNSVNRVLQNLETCAELRSTCALPSQASRGVGWC